MINPKNAGIRYFFGVENGENSRVWGPFIRVSKLGLMNCKENTFLSRFLETCLKKSHNILKIPHFLGLEMSLKNEPDSRV